MSTQAVEKPVALRIVTSEEAMWRALARELAMDILPRKVILENFGLDDAEFQRIAQSPGFATLYREAIQTWGSAMNTKERVELKTLALVEESLETMFGSLVDKREPLSARVALFQALQKGAGIGGNVQGSGAEAARVSITINTGTNAVKVTHTPEPPTIEGSALQIED